MLLQQCSFDQRPDIFIATTKMGCDSTCTGSIQSSLRASAFYRLIQRPPGLSAVTEAFCANTVTTRRCGYRALETGRV